MLTAYSQVAWVPEFEGATNHAVGQPYLDLAGSRRAKYRYCEQRGLIVSFSNLAGVTRRHFTIYLTVFSTRLKQSE